jgi:hypothetical protein
MTTSPLTELFGSPIHTCTRADLVRDGDLIDVSDTAKQFLHWPVAVTRAVWCECVQWSAEDTQRQIPQDEPGRLLDVLLTLSVALRTTAMERASSQSSRLCYQCWCIPRDGESRQPRLVKLKALAHPGDAGELVITVLLDDEAED